MKHPKKTVAPSSVSSQKTENKPTKDKANEAAKIDHKTDRPGFDLSGSSDKTHAGTGLGLGNNAFDSAGQRRLPGRQLDNKLTIPRWSSTMPVDTKRPTKNQGGRKT